MYFKYIPGIWSLAVSFFIVMVLGLFAVVYYRVRGAKLFGLSMLFLGCWIIGEGMAILSADYYTKNFWSNTACCLFVALHACWFIMVLQFGGNRDWLKPSKLLPLLLLPALSVILVWTKNFSSLTYYGYLLDSGVRLPIANRSFKWLIALIPAYTYLLDLIAIILVVRKSVFYKSIYGMRMSAFILGPIISVCPTLLYILSFWLIKGYDITGIFISLSAVIAATGGYNLFVSAPIAREAAVDNISIAILVINNYGIIADVNNAARAMFEQSKKSLLGMPAEGVLSSLSRELCDLQNGDSKEIEATQGSDGKTRFLRAQRMPIISKRGIAAGYVILISDVTEMRAEQLRILQQTSTMVANKERQKLARDLHDNLAQVLASISMQAQGICNELEYEGTDRVYLHLSRLVDISQSAHREIRAYIQSVRETQADEKSAAVLARESIEEFRNQTGVNVSVDTRELAALNRLSAGYQANCYYILRETLNNIRKHALGVKNVTISVSEKGGRLRLFLRDDGCGFDPNRTSDNQFGLKIMRERAAEMGANLNIDAQPGKGTEIELTLPLA